MLIYKIKPYLCIQPINQTNDNVNRTKNHTQQQVHHKGDLRIAWNTQEYAALLS